MHGRTESSPPRVAAWLIERMLPASARDGVIGDLQERFALRVARHGARRARHWYRRQALGFALQLPRLLATQSRVGVSAGVAGWSADVRVAARTLRRRPGFTAAAVLILALAVGANTTVFSVVDAVLLERLPFPDADRLVMLWDVYPPEAEMGDRAPITLEHYRLWSQRGDLFEVVGAWESTSAAIVEGEWPERIDGALVTASLLPLLGARAALGRLLLPDDEATGAEAVVVLSHGLWTSRFGGDPGLVGRTITINGRATRVVGVTAADFWFYDPYSALRSVSGRSAEAARLWQPLPAGAFRGELDYPRYRVIARVRDGVGVEAAAASAASARRNYPPTSTGADAEIRLMPLQEQVVLEARPRLLGLFGAVSLVLLIACVNLISLMLVHLQSRRAELSLRAALGAGRVRLIRQLIVESTLLAFVGGGLGLLLSIPATAWLVTFVPRGLPLAHRVGLDPGVAAFGITLSILSGAVVGLLAALQVRPAGLANALAASPRTSAGNRATRRIHGTLVSVEVALSLVLLIAATLLLRSLSALHDADIGFRPDKVLTFHTTRAADVAGNVDHAFFTALEERLRDLPGISAVGSTSALPFSRWVQRARVEVGDGEPPYVDYRLVSDGYFEAIGITVRSGRAFGSADRAGAAPVAIVNEAFADRWLGGVEDPVGRGIAILRGDRVEHTIVGVVANVKHNELFEPPRPIVYATFAQTPLQFRRFAVRVDEGNDPLALVEPIRSAARDIDPAQPLDDFIRFEALVGQSMEEENFYTQLVAAFAAIAVLLTLVGIYGVVSFTTRQRDREVGIRMALGARSGGVQSMVVRQGLGPVWLGLALGWLGGLATTGLLRSLLHGVPERDLTSYLLATAAFALVAAFACFAPARRAARLDPVRVLRGD